MIFIMKIMQNRKKVMSNHLTTLAYVSISDKNDM